MGYDTSDSNLLILRNYVTIYFVTLYVKTEFVMNLVSPNP